MRRAAGAWQVTRPTATVAGQMLRSVGDGQGEGLADGCMICHSIYKRCAERRKERFSSKILLGRRCKGEGRHGRG